jgi:hypothetical protein
MTTPDNKPDDKGNPGPWYAGKIDDVTVGYLQSRGLHDKSVEEVALASIKAHQEATKMLSAPQAELLRIPTKEDDPAWANVWSRLGAPADKKDYDLSPLKFSNGKPLDDVTAQFIRDQAAALHLSKGAALQFGQDIIKQTEAEEGRVAGDRKAKLDEGIKALKANWGANYEAHKFVATQGAAKLGLGAEEVAQLESLIGYDKIMEAMRKVGAMTGEDTFVKGNTTNGVITREEAMQKKQELMSDVAWKQRYLGGGKAELREMTALNSIILGIAA